jgi:RTX calcium-binding nonapeptide repeat (4 copies)
VVRRVRLIAVVGTFLIGCVVLLVLVGCAGVRSEAPREEQEQGRSPEATASEQARCEGTRTIEIPQSASASAPPTTTNDLPGCPEGGPLSGTDKRDFLDGKDGDDEIRGLGGPDFILGGAGNDVIYGGPGDDSPLVGEGGDDVIYGGDGDESEIVGGNGNDVIYGGDGNDQIFEWDDWGHDKLYCGKGKDTYEADKNDFVSSSCETALEEETTAQQGAGDLKRPPDSTLSYGGREVKGSLGSYCFSGNSGGTCVDTGLIVPPREKTLTVPSGSEMVFRYGGQRPSGRVQAVAIPLTKNARSTASPDPNRSERSLDAHGSGVERTIPVGLPPGEYLVNVFVIVVVEPQNDAAYWFRVMVE